MCGQPIHCTCLCISHGLWVLGVGGPGWAKGWGGGPTQMLSRVYTWYIPGISIYLVYTRYILPPQTPIPGICASIAAAALAGWRATSVASKILPAPLEMCRSMLLLQLFAGAGLRPATVLAHVPEQAYGLQQCAGAGLRPATTPVCRSGMATVQCECSHAVSRVVVVGHSKPPQLLNCVGYLIVIFAFGHKS